ncbi:MAG: hypothetical protein R3C44_05020 [Chloroflexota bacterium]
MKREDELTLEEWDKALASLERPRTGLRLAAESRLCTQDRRVCPIGLQALPPGIINIPTNSILRTIPEKVERIATSCPDSQLIINLSLDGWGKSMTRFAAFPEISSVLKNALSNY